MKVFFQNFCNIFKFEQIISLYALNFYKIFATNNVKIKMQNKFKYILLELIRKYKLFWISIKSDWNCRNIKDNNRNRKKYIFKYFYVKLNKEHIRNI